MTSWMDRLRPGSFRGFPFEVLDLEHPEGRKVARHGFPLRSGAKGEDMGGVDMEFQVEAFLIGDDCLDQRDAFRRVLNLKGTGPLILPWLDQVTVRLTDARVRYQDNEQGIVRYRLSFMEESDAPVQQADDDTVAQANAAADAAMAQARASAEAAIVVGDQPQFVLDEAAKVVTRFSDRYDQLIAPLKAGAEVLGDMVQKGMDLRRDVIDLVTRPADLISQISDLVVGVRTLAATPADALTALGLLFGIGDDLDAVTGTTPSRQAQAGNQAALVALIAGTAAAESVKALADSDFAAYQDAVAARDSMAAILDDLAVTAADAGDQDGWSALEAARTAMVRDLTARGASLARLTRYTPTSDVPAIVLAYRLYGAGDIEAMAADIVARNAITHPGFVPGGVELEVLSHG